MVEPTLPEWLAGLAEATETLARVEHSLVLMRESDHFIEEVLWQARWRHRDEAKAEVARTSRGAMARRVALVERILERLPVAGAFERLQFGARLGDLAPDQLEFLAAVRFEAPEDGKKADSSARHRQWYDELFLASEDYRKEHHVGPSQHALAHRVSREYSTVSSRLATLRSEGYDVDRLLAHGEWTKVDE